MRSSEMMHWVENPASRQSVKRNDHGRAALSASMGIISPVNGVGGKNLKRSGRGVTAATCFVWQRPFPCLLVLQRASPLLFPASRLSLQEKESYPRPYCISGEVSSLYTPTCKCFRKQVILFFFLSLPFHAAGLVWWSSYVLLIRNI